MIKPCGLVCDSCVLRTRSLSTIKFFNKTGHNAPSPPSPSSSSSLSAPSQLLPASSLFAPLPPSPVSQPRLPVRLAPPPTPLSSPPRTSLLPCPRGLRSSLFANYCLLPPPPPCALHGELLTHMRGARPRLIIISSLSSMSMCVHVCVHVTSRPSRTPAHRRIGGGHNGSRSDCLRASSGRRSIQYQHHTPQADSTLRHVAVPRQHSLLLPAATAQGVVHLLHFPATEHVTPPRPAAAP